MSSCGSEGRVPKLPALYIPLTEAQAGSSEFELYTLFNAVIPVASVRVISRRGNASNAHAFINLDRSPDMQLVEGAMSKLQGQSFRGDTLNIKFAAGRWPPQRPVNIFIKGLEASATPAALRHALGAFGSVMHCRIVTDSREMSKRYAFARLDPLSAAQALVEQGELRVGHAESLASVRPFRNLLGRRSPQPPLSKQKSAATRHTDTCSVYVAPVPAFVKRESDLARLFSPFGAIASTAIKQESGAGLRFGFVNFTSVQSAERACEAMHGKDVGSGTVLKVNKSAASVSTRPAARPPSAPPPSPPPSSPLRSAAAPFTSSSHSVRARGGPRGHTPPPRLPPPSVELTASRLERLQLPRSAGPAGADRGGSDEPPECVLLWGIGKDVSEDDLKFAVEMHGKVTKVEIHRDAETLVSEGTARVHYASPAEAHAAAAKLHGARMYGRPVSAAAAQSSSTRGSSQTMDKPGRGFSSPPSSGYIPATGGPFGNTQATMQQQQQQQQRQTSMYGGFSEVPGPGSQGYWGPDAALPPNCLTARAPSAAVQHRPALWHVGQHGAGAHVPAGPVHLGGAVYFEPPSPKELEMAQQAQWASASAAGYLPM